MFEPQVFLTDLDEQGGARDRDDQQWIVVDDRQQVLVVDGDLPRGAANPMAGIAAGNERVHLLGLDRGAPVWAVGVDGDGRGLDLPATVDPDGEAIWVHLRPLFGSIDDQEWVLAGRAAQVLGWDRDHRFCGRCANPTDHHPSDRARVCPECRLMSFPRLSPAVIMLVERDGPSGPEVLLAWGRQFPGRFFSALAGFVEPGESLEQCVVREVKEETGIEVADVRYFGSQPWPFPHSLMIGFNARYVAGDITIQEEEIVEAGWFSPNELPPVPRGGMSIAGWLIDDWLQRLSGG